MPYDSNLSIADQVSASITSSLKNLRPSDDTSSTSYIDCLILHSPFPTMPQTQEAWRAMEECVPNQARTLGISNIYNLNALEQLYSFAQIRPSVIQNRFYPETNYDSGIRNFCREKGIVYQSFWTLTANPKLLRSKVVGLLAERVGVNVEVALYGLVLGLGGSMSVLDGTTNLGRMEEDLRGMEMVWEWVGENGDAWEEVLREFRMVVDR